MRRLTVIGVLFAALIFSAVQLPASVCAVVSAPIGKSCQPGCCANKVCCVDSQKNKTLPATPAVKDSGATQELVAIPTTNRLPLFGQLPSLKHSYSASAQTIARAQPQLAVLCTFLI